MPTPAGYGTHEVMLEMLLFAMIQWGLLTAVIARAKHRDAAGWFGIGAALPVIGLVMAIMATPKPRATRTTVAAT